MTRRAVLWSALWADAMSAAEGPLIIPVRRVRDVRAKCTPEEMRRFFSTIWPEAVRDFGRCAIQLAASDASGEIGRTAADRPVFKGVEHGVLNVILTDHVPMYWDNGRALAGVTTIHEGYHLCVIAVPLAHGNQLPFISTNTCVHEILHALLQDIFVRGPKWYQTGERELRADSYATGMWLFHDCSAIRKSARAYLGRLRPQAASIRLSK